MNLLTSALRKLGILRVITLDFETFWASDYTLSSMDTRQYVRDPRFKAHGYSIATDGGGISWAATPVEQDALLRGIDWSTTALLCANAKFDGCILVERFGIRPKLYLDTVQMANAHVKPFTRRASLDATHRYLAALYPERNPPAPKGNATMSFKGIRDLPPALLNETASYCVHDSRITRWCAIIMLPWFTASELLVMSQTTEAYLKPKLRIDTELLMGHVRSERARKDALLAQLNLDKKQLMSNNQFAELLEAQGVAAPKKISEKTGNTSFAFAKTDLQFLALQHHPNPTVSMLVQIRLGVKSTIEETRAQTLINLVDSDIDPAPVALAYASAVTGRHGGQGGSNFQNLGRQSPIRKAIVAPPGHSLVVVDSSQIEARVMAWLAGETLAIETFRAGKDLYSEVGTVMFRQPVSKKETPLLRQLSKVACLACQFALSGGGYYQHVTLAGESITRARAFEVVDLWREANPRIVKLWGKLTAIIDFMCANKPDTEHVFQMLRFGYDKKRNALYITLPTGLRIWYPNPHWATYKDRSGWAFKADKDTKPTFLSRNLLANNVIQSLARSITIGLHAVILQTRYNLCWSLTVHDELLYVVPDHLAPRVATLVQKVMRQPPKWWPDLVLDAEVSIAKRYGDAKG
jgi:DNA polymerase